MLLEINVVRSGFVSVFSTFFPLRRSATFVMFDFVFHHFVFTCSSVPDPRQL